MTGRLRCPQANSLGSAIVNNVNVLDLLLGQGKQDLTQGQGYHQRKLSQIYPDRTGYQQTGFKNVQVCVPLSASPETLTALFPAICPRWLAVLMLWHATRQSAVPGIFSVKCAGF